MISLLAKSVLADISTYLPKMSDNTSGQMEEIHAQLRAKLESTLQKMNVVTREEFDAQSAVLLRTCEKVKHLEQQLLTLEESINNNHESQD